MDLIPLCVTSLTYTKIRATFFKDVSLARASSRIWTSSPGGKTFLLEEGGNNCICDYICCIYLIFLLLDTCQV